MISARNAEEVPIAPGTAVFLAEDGEGVVPAGPDSDAARFVGVAVRSPSKVPETYGANGSPWGPADLVEVLVRGTIVVRLPGETCVPGGKVYIALGDGAFTSQEAGNETIELPNCAWRGPSEISEPCAELLIKSRHLL